MGDLNNPNENNNEQQQTNQNVDQTQNQQPQNQQPQNQQSQNQQPLYVQPLYQQPDPNQNLNQGQGQYQQYQQYQQPMQPRKDNGMAIGAMVCGIVSFVFSCCLWYLAIPLAIISIVLSIMVLKKHKDGKGMAIAGLVLSGITILIAIFVIIVSASVLGNESFWNELQQRMETTTY